MRVVFITTYGYNIPVFVLDFNAARSTTETANRVMCFCHNNDLSQALRGILNAILISFVVAILKTLFS
jgi:hypothetical protein